MQIIDLEEPMTNKEKVEVKKALKSVIENGVKLNDVLFEIEQINGYVTVSHNNKYIIIENTKGEFAEVYLKTRTFDKIAKKLGYTK